MSAQADTANAHGQAKNTQLFDLIVKKSWHAFCLRPDTTTAQRTATMLNHVIEVLHQLTLEAIALVMALLSAGFCPESAPSAPKKDAAEVRQEAQQSGPDRAQAAVVKRVDFGDADAHTSARRRSSV